MQWVIFKVILLHIAYFTCTRSLIQAILNVFFFWGHNCRMLPRRIVNQEVPKYAPNNSTNTSQMKNVLPMYILSNVPKQETPQSLTYRYTHYTKFSKISRYSNRRTRCILGERQIDYFTFQHTHESSSKFTTFFRRTPISNNGKYRSWRSYSLKPIF